MLEDRGFIGLGVRGRNWSEAVGGWDGGADEMLVAEGDVEGCDGAGYEELSDNNVALAVIKDVVFSLREA